MKMKIEGPIIRNAFDFTGDVVDNDLEVEVVVTVAVGEHPGRFSYSPQQAAYAIL